MQEVGANTNEYQITEFGEIPNNWKIKYFGEFATTYRYPTFYDIEYHTDGVPVLNIGNIDNQTWKLSTNPNDYKKIDKKTSDLFSKTIVEEGDLVLAVRGATIGKFALVPKALAVSNINANLLRITLQKEVCDPLYFWYYTQTYLGGKEFRKLISYTAKETIQAGKLKFWKIVLPNIEEQVKIASILSKVDELIQKADQIIEQTQRLKKALMQRLFTKGIEHTKFKNTVCGEIPVEWDVCAVGEKCKVGSGGTPSRTDPRYFKGDIPWVKTTELNYNILTDTEEKISEKAIKKSSAKVYPKGTFVIAMVGLEAVGTRGKCAILGIDAAVNQACAAIQTPETINTYFLFYYYQTITNKVMSLVAGTKRQNLNLELVKSIEIPVPQLTEQEKIVSIVSNMDKYIHNQKYKGFVCKNLKKGLMQQLLTGKIRVKV